MYRSTFSFRLRVQRYDSGEYFKPHFDAGFRRENGEKSFLSVQIFLNDVRKQLISMLGFLICLFITGHTSVQKLTIKCGVVVHGNCYR